MNEPHLRLKGVHRHYGKDETLVRVLEAADLEVMSGELVAIVAPSGAGKSTLLHLSGLLERPQSGEIEITGTPTVALSERGRTLLRRTTIGYVYQFHHLLPEFTALENVSMPQLIAGKSQGDANKRSQDLLDLLGVGGTLIGLILGLIVASNAETLRSFISNLTNVPIFPPEVFFLSSLPSKIDATEVTVVASLALGLSFLATLYPAWRAAQYDPVEALRYE